jgi:integrase
MRVISEGPTKITKTTIDAAWRRRRSEHRLIVRDAECRGLALVVNATATRWEFAYRPRGIDPLTGRRWPNRTVTLGNPATHSTEAARIAANAIKGQVNSGADPAAEKQAKAEAERRKRATTLGRLFDDYAQALPKRKKMRGHGAPSPRYIAEELAQIRMALSEMGAADKPAAELIEADIRRLIEKAEGVTTARHRFGPLSRFLDWCQDAGHVQANPCALLARSRRPRPPEARAHYLTPTDIARLWNAAAQLREPVWRDLARFLMTVPCRRSEATRLDWSHLNLAAAEWRQHGKLTKNRDPHRLYLHTLALKVLRDRERPTSGKGLVFPAPLSGKAIDTFTDIKAALAKAIKPQDGESGGLDGWTWHDFRRSFATALGEAGIPEPVADAVLNHRQSATRGGVLGVYQRASRWPEQAKAMQLWGDILAAAVKGREAALETMQVSARIG